MALPVGICCTDYTGSDHSRIVLPGSGAALGPVSRHGRRFSQSQAVQSQACESLSRV